MTTPRAASNKPEKHEHNFNKRVAIKDRYIGGLRYILARQCECGALRAWDLVEELPGRKNV